MFSVSRWGFLVLIFGASLTQAGAAPQVLEEKQLLYKDINDGNTDRMQTSIQFVPVDSSGSIPSYLDIYGLRKNKAGIASYVVVRSTFFLPLSIDEARARIVNPMVLSQYSKKLKVQSCSGAQCEVSIPTFISDIQMTLKYAQVDPSNASGTWIEFLKALHNPDFVTLHEFEKIAAVFKHGSSFSAFYNRGPRLTWVQGYQIFSVKQSAYDKGKRIPFFNLEKSIRGMIEDLLLDARSSLLREKKYTFFMNSSTRLPAATGPAQELTQQKADKVDDPQGDEALIDRALQMPGKLFQVLFGIGEVALQHPRLAPHEWERQDLAPKSDSEPSDLAEEGVSIQGRDAPIHLRRFSEMVDQVLLEEFQRGLTPRRGLFHEWSPETLRKHKGLNVVTKFSKLFVCLAIGITSTYMKTGQEKNLWDWLLAQDENSVTFPELFRASYRLHGGDVYLSLLSIENILSSHWRYKSRESLPSTKRLRPITSGYNYDGDKYGTWYHFFGMILYGYTTGQGFTSDLVGRIEAVGSNILSPHLDQTQKQWYNKLGGYIGANLRKSVIYQTFRHRASNPTVLEESYYLNQHEDFRDRLPLEKSAQLSLQVHVGKSQTPLLRVVIGNKSPQELKSCVVEVMRNFGKGYFGPGTRLYKKISLQAGGQTEFSWVGQRPRAVRVYVSRCEQGPDQATEIEIPQQDMIGPNSSKFPFEKR